ncbi:MAG: hypothetical protein GDA39_09435 [Hyphomonadaceae bacterium]|nr:hypothetical protein [Hyphomonadaceae bacterium]MBC6413061.1 hypothetical protein [Hyphomonadaceae bacterium]
MSDRYKNPNPDHTFERREARMETAAKWKAKGLRFLRYLSTRKMECWGFFAAGFFIATIF